jgi:hypothetical protein
LITSGLITTHGNLNNYVLREKTIPVTLVQPVESYVASSPPAMNMVTQVIQGTYNEVLAMTPATPSSTSIETGEISNDTSFLLKQADIPQNTALTIGYDLGASYLKLKAINMYNNPTTQAICVVSGNGTISCQ